MVICNILHDYCTALYQSIMSKLFRSVKKFYEPNDVRFSKLSYASLIGRELYNMLTRITAFVRSSHTFCDIEHALKVGFSVCPVWIVSLALPCQVERV